MSNIRIKCCELREDLFDQILKDYEYVVKLVDEIDDYITGYPDKKTILYDGVEYMICPEYIIASYTDYIPFFTDWKQGRVRRARETSIPLTQTIYGSKAYAELMNMLSKVYTKDQIEERLNMFEAEYDPQYAQYHYTPSDGVDIKDRNKVIKIPNCLYYDINGAHNDALCEIFPKAKDLLLKMFKKRHKDPIKKLIINYAVGELCNKNHRKTYNGIVQRTTKSLFKALDNTDNKEIYANTDGFIISAKSDLIGASKELGKFKIEYKGDIYVYVDKNYGIIQMKKEYKGNCFTCVRKYIDLPKGEVVHYDKKKLKYSYAPVNITKEKICVK